MPLLPGKEMIMTPSTRTILGTLVAGEREAVPAFDIRAARLVHTRVLLDAVRPGREPPAMKQ